MPLLGLFLNCGTAISIKMMKPSEFNVGHLKKIAVLDFKFRGSWEYAQKEEDPKSMEDVAVDILAKVFGVDEKKAAPPDPVRAYPGEQVSSKMVAALVQNGHYQVLERKKMRTLLQEHKLTMSGLIQESKAAQVGELLGVNALLFGNGNYVVKDKGDWAKKTVTQKDGSKSEITVYRLIRTAKAQVTYRIVNVASGEVVASKVNTVSKKSTVDADDENAAYKQIVSWQDLVDAAVTTIVNNSVKQIAPHFVWRKRKIEDGKSPGMKTGIKYVKRGLWEEARQSWEKVLASRNDKAVKDYVAARYNLGVYYEVIGDLTQAEEQYRECFDQSNKDKYLDARLRVQRRRTELEKLEKQLQD